METNLNMVKESITPTIAKNNIDTVNKTDKIQASNEKIDISSSNKSYKDKSLDKSKFTQRTEIEIQLTNKINQGILYQLVYLGKVPKWKNCQKYILSKTV